MVRKCSAGLLVKLIPIIFYFIVACTHEDDPLEPVPAPQSCLLKKVVTSDGTVTISHNEKGLPVKMEHVYSNSSHNRTCTIEYDAADNIVKLSQENGYIEYEYDAENKVISGGIYYRTDSSKPFLTAREMSYRYNDQGYMDSAFYDLGYIDSVYNKYHYNRYEYDANGILVKSYLKYYSDPEVVMNEYLAFDDKKNPHFDNYFVRYTTLTVPGISLTGLDLPFISDHNLKSKNVLLAGGSIANHTNTFEYNELGYPTSATLVISVPALTFTSQFYYDCK